MRECILAGSLILLSTLAFAQKDYTLQFESEGFSAYTKMGKAKVDGVQKPAIMLKIVNEADSAISYSMEMDFFFHGKRVESVEETLCIDAGKTAQGKLNGMYFQSESLSAEQMTSDAFEYELTVEIEGKKIVCRKD